MNNDSTIKLYQSISEANKPRVFEHWHASSLAECPKAHYMKRLGIPALNVPSAAKILRWSAGHVMEEVIRPHLSSIVEGEIKSNERLTSKKLDLTGEYDNLAPKTLLEIKSVHDYAFIEREGRIYLKEQDGFNARGQNKWKAKETPYLHHEIQNHGYVKLLKEKGVEVKKIIYVYLSMSGRIVVYDTDVQEDIMNNVDKRLEVLNKAWETQTPPPCICEESHPLWGGVMQYCSYRQEKGECCVI